MEWKPDWLPGFHIQIYCNRSMFLNYFYCDLERVASREVCD